jgi:hypothetical protein
MNSRISRFASVFLLAGCTVLLAATGDAKGRGPSPLLWPLPIHEGCPSIFGESRSNHFHGGVDFRTHREEGWPVLAPADCGVERIRREPSGYGRVIYLKLDDGRTVVFGHLCRFAGGALGLEDRLRKACAKEGTSFPGDISFDPPVRVKAGQVVAYSGQLGIGSPHLHMEVRDGDDQLDPFVEGLPTPAGLAAPRILGVTFVPRDASSLVDGSFLPLRMKAIRRADGVYALERAIRLQGAVDAALVVDDSYGTEDIRCGINIAEASVNGKEFFRADIRRFDLKQTFQGPSFWMADQGWDGAEAILLRKDKAVNIPGIEGDGLPHATDSRERTLRATARNRAGHAATVTAILQEDRSALPLRTDLPGRGFRLTGHRFLTGGLLLELKRRDRLGGTSLTLGGRALDGFLVREEKGDELSVLIPLDSFPEKGGALAAGGEDLGLSVGTGPSVLECGGIRLRIPEGAWATSTEGKGERPSAAFRVHPPGLRPKAAVIFPKASGSGMWALGAGGRFMGTAGGEVPYKGDGSYALRLDKTPPAWGKPFRATIPHLDAPEIRVSLKDAGSGPDVTTLKAKVDGKPVYPDWDADAGVVRFDASGLAPGSHTIEASVSDRAGNRAALKRLTVVIPKK